MSAAGFWARVETTPDCWLWTGRRSDDGYGRFEVDGRREMAHRYAYSAIVGPVPVGLNLDHLCHNADPTCPGGPACLHRRCVNPAHLEPVTNRENLLRGKKRLPQDMPKVDLSAGPSGCWPWMARPCVNPAHLEAVTPRTNVPRREIRGVCKRGHPRTPENVYVYPSGTTRCRLCHRDEYHARRAAGKERVGEHR